MRAKLSRLVNLLIFGFHSSPALQQIITQAPENYNGWTFKRYENAKLIGRFIIED